MRYLYKINSRYDGFRPSCIPDRLADGRFLILGWARYLDAVNVHDEVWIIFKGPGFENGVYVQGLVAVIDRPKGELRLRVRHHSTTTPITDPETSAALLDCVSVAYRQVFLWPADRDLRDNCHADDCAARRCNDCGVWNSLPQIEPINYRPPPSLSTATVVPAYWIVPSRCFLFYKARRPAPWVRRATEMFGAFKVGEKRYAYPLAAGIKAALETRGLLAFDAVVPIPLSPEKAEAKELNRTAALAGELVRLLPGARVRHALSLSQPISKRRMQSQGHTVADFKARYRNFLNVKRTIANLDRVLLLDDVITNGSTMSVAIEAIRAVKPDIDITVAAAGQMIVKAVVVNENGPAW